jgi:hypothetical protein
VLRSGPTKTAKTNNLRVPFSVILEVSVDRTPLVAYLSFATLGRRNFCEGEKASIFLLAMHSEGIVTAILACGLPPEIIQQAIWLYVRFTLSFHDVEGLLAERGILVSYETIRGWVNHFGPMVAADLRKRRPKPHTTWHLDEVYLKIDGRMVYLLRGVDAEGEVLDVLVQSRRNKRCQATMVPCPRRAPWYLQRPTSSHLGKNAPSLSGLGDADFAKLVELFDEHGVSFVSITQSFNTTSSMGRLTLNVLLSFAQFEREVIGERVRDKIAASKRKGLWVGGPVPVGYRCVDKKLEIVPEEAEAVRTILTLYLELGSMGALLAELDRRGIKTKVNGRREGQKRGGIRFGVGPLAHLLKNRFYVGEVPYRGEVYRGEHEPILSRDLFAAVQAKLAANTVDRQLRLRGSAAFLAGRLYDDRGNRMTPTHANKKGVRYRYYVSQALLQNRKAEAGRIARVPAPEVNV